MIIKYITVGQNAPSLTEAPAQHKTTCSQALKYSRYERILRRLACHCDRLQSRDIFMNGNREASRQFSLSVRVGTVYDLGSHKLTR